MKHKKHFVAEQVTLKGYIDRKLRAEGSSLAHNCVFGAVFGSSRDLGN